MAEIDRIWRGLPTGHVWSGWAAIDSAPETVWLYRLRQNWRRFQLLKEGNSYVLVDESGIKIGGSAILSEALCVIEVAPAFADA